MGFIPSFGTLLRVTALCAAVGVASTAALLYRYQRLLIYPASMPAGSRTEVMTPDQFGMPYTEEKLQTPDGETLRVFVMLQDGSAERAAGKTPMATGKEAARGRPTVLFLHANAGNMGHRLPLAKIFYQRFGTNVVMLSYRGYGLSTGSPSEVGIRIDAQTTLDFIREHPVLGKTKLVAYGQSLGGAVAVDVAQRNFKHVHALIVENTFLSIPEMIPHVLPPIKPFTILCREYWLTGELIRKLPKTLPILFLSGRQDELVPPTHMDTLYARCSSEQKHFKAIEDGMHNDTCSKPGYFEEISSFLRRYVVPTSTASSAASSPALTAPPHPELRKRGAGPGSDLLTDEEDWVKMSNPDISKM